MPSTKPPTDFADGISNETLCTYFFVMFVLITAAVGLTLLVRVWSARRRSSEALGILLVGLPYLALAAVNSLFLYLMCTRSLLK